MISLYHTIIIIDKNLWVQIRGAQNILNASECKGLGLSCIFSNQQHSYAVAFKIQGSFKHVNIYTATYYQEYIMGEDITLSIIYF